MYKAGQSMVSEAPPADDKKTLARSHCRRARAMPVLPKALFLAEVSRERFRSDRSGSPVSLLLLTLGEEGDATHDVMSQALPALRGALRQTDSVGILDANVVGVLLPDTDSRNVDRVAEKVCGAGGYPVASVVKVSYPHVILDRLQAQAKAVDDREGHYFVRGPKRRAWELRTKRGIDILGAVVGLVLLSPLMLATMLAVKYSSPGDAIFRQVRVGKNLVPFTFYKFRSMHSGSDDSVHRNYLEKLISGEAEQTVSEEDGKRLYKMASDPRVTRVGRFIRKTSIDELPQLFNVLKGDMSLVGPRPPIPYETAKYRCWHLRRILEVKPGLTGLWQVVGRSETTFEDMVRLDLKYARDWSVAMDIKLIIRTVRVVLECKGAV
ncbi:sugar transferase [Parahaliea mediterranea]|uniref:Sugar transferase n=1 Tax=Parahaliea mediterranea TaxID=651086 RepID=A0A939IKT1_9GAMM|nr:sugar transferase [Parahaliea mediterranea]MBN7795258.1 sugar transferase [Parahaliea mediterranea]